MRHLGDRVQRVPSMSKRRTGVLVAAGVIAVLAVTSPAPAADPTFADPTARIVNPAHVHLGELVYVAPFATLRATSSHDIHIDNESNVQDSVTVDATAGSVHLGEMVILAHGATVKGEVEIGEGGVCPGGATHCPSFVGFNAEVDGGIVEKDAMVIHLARVGPGVTIPSGCKVLPGRNVTSQSQVGVPPACNPPITDRVTADDRAFMASVVEVNVCFAEKYTELAAADPSNVRGINYDPDCPFNPGNQLPTLDGVQTRDPDFRNRIIGDVRLHDDEDTLDDVMGASISLRADEGAPFEVGTIASMGNRTTFHALEHTHLHLGNRGRYGVRSLVHGGPDPEDPTTTGRKFRLGREAVFFRSTAGNNVTVGCRSLVQESSLGNGTTIPNKKVVISNVVVNDVEWGSCSGGDD